MGDNPVGKKVNTPKGKCLWVNTLVFTFLRKYPNCLNVKRFIYGIRFLREPCRQKTKNKHYKYNYDSRPISSKITSLLLNKTKTSSSMKQPDN